MGHLEESCDSNAWRDRLLGRFLLTFGPIGMVGSVIVFALTPGSRHWTGLLYFALAALQLVAGLRSNWQFRVRLAALLAFPVLASVLTYLIAGFASNAAHVGGVAVAFAGLFVSRRTTLWLVAGLVLLTAAVGFCMTHGQVPPPEPALISVLSSTAWLRTTVVAGLLWMLAGVAISYVVTHVEALAQAERQSVSELRREQERRVQAEAERLSAERVAREAQKRELAGRLAVGVAHDFNNVLQVIQGWAELGLSGAASEEVRSEAREALDVATRQGSALTRQLLALGKPSARAPRPLELASSVDAAAHALRRVLPKDIPLVVEHSEPLHVVADDGELQQVLFNLVLNARDAMPHGGTITIATERENGGKTPLVGGELEPGAPYARLSVKDEGSGIDEALRDQIFEPFFSSKESGTGLGLSNVLGIARANGGAVALESRAGEGSRFSVYFPIAGEHESRRLVVAGKESSTSIRARNVLLLEDHPDVRRLMERILSAGGYSVQAVASGSEARERMDRLKQGEIDVFCTDGILPDEPTRLVLEAFERTQPGGVVLIVSGYVPEELTRRGVEQGRYRVLPKPFAPRELLGAVDELLLERRSQRPAANGRP